MLYTTVSVYRSSSSNFKRSATETLTQYQVTYLQDSLPVALSLRRLKIANYFGVHTCRALGTIGGHNSRNQVLPTELNINEALGIFCSTQWRVDTGTLPRSVRQTLLQAHKNSGNTRFRCCAWNISRQSLAAHPWYRIRGDTDHQSRTTPST
jgi:hypothetical protein